MKQITTIVIGAGGRGRNCSSYALDNPEKLKVVGVAEPIEALHSEFAKTRSVPEENCFTTWEDVFAREKFADTVMICTQDKMHFAPRWRRLKQGMMFCLKSQFRPPRRNVWRSRMLRKRKVLRLLCAMF